ADAAGAGAKVKDAGDIAAVQPGGETLLDQLANGGTGNEDALVHIKRHLAEPSLVGDVRHRLAFLDAHHDACDNALAVGRWQTGMAGGVVDVEGQGKRGEGTRVG